MIEHGYRRVQRRLVAAWAALLMLMLASLGSSYVALGAGNLAAGVAIAIVKTAIVAWVFMRLARASGVVRIAAASGLAIWLLLASLGGIDVATRPHEPASAEPFAKKLMPGGAGIQGR